MDKPIDGRIIIAVLKCKLIIRISRYWIIIVSPSPPSVMHGTNRSSGKCFLGYLTNAEIAQ